MLAILILQKMQLYKEQMHKILVSKGWYLHKIRKTIEIGGAC